MRFKLSAESLAPPALSLLATQAMWPYWRDYSYTPKMVALGLAMPAFAILLRSRPEPFGLSLLIYAGLSLSWAAVSPDALAGMLWTILVLLGLSLGRSLDLDKTLFWFSIFTLPHVAVAWIQWLGDSENPTLDYLIDIALIFQGNKSQPAGLLVNKNFLGEALVLVILWSAWTKRYLLVSLALPGLWLAQSKESVLSLGAGLLAWMLPRTWPLVAAPVVLALIAFNPSSFEVRLGIWNGVLSGVSLWGHGIGQFYTAFPLYVSDTLLYRDDHAHNDLIELWFELGAFGFMWGSLLAATVYFKSSGMQRVLLVALGAQSMVAFPLHLPTMFFLGTVLMGNILGLGHSQRSVRASSESALQQGASPRRPANA